MGNLKENFWGQNIQVVVFWNLSFPRSAGPMLKTRKNTVRNQFKQQRFEVISFQKPRRVYPAIWYNLKPFAHKKGRFTLSTPAKLVHESRKFVKGQKRYNKPAKL